MSNSVARAVVTALVVLTGCRYQPTPILLQGTATDVGALAGSWEGDYVGSESRRNGTITFTVQAGKDTAYGDVVMESSPGQRITAADVTSGAHAAHAQAPEVLRVTFVNVRGGFVEGVLEPYVAPDCQCVVTTTFRGALQGDTVKGEYVTTGHVSPRQTGTWSVRRKR
jgi:hypothetical protein